MTRSRDDDQRRPVRCSGWYAATRRQKRSRRWSPCLLARSADAEAPGPGPFGTWSCGRTGPRLASPRRSFPGPGAWTRSGLAGLGPSLVVPCGLAASADTEAAERSLAG